MTAHIKTLLDIAGRKIYPRTKNAAVYNDKGIRLSEQHFLIEGPIEFVNTGSETTFVIKDKRIRSNAVVHIYYKNSAYDIKPSYEINKGYISVTIPEFPSDRDVITVDVVEVVNL